MPKKIAKGFTILELLVVLAVMGVFTLVAYPNISKWITDREVKKEVYEIVEFIKERKSEVESGKYGMTQIILNRQLQVATMSLEKFFQIPFSIPKMNEDDFPQLIKDLVKGTPESKPSGSNNVPGPDAPGPDVPGPDAPVLMFPALMPPVLMSVVLILSTP